MDNSLCSNFNEDTFITTLNAINDTITKGQFQENLKLLSIDPCSSNSSIKGGKKGKKRSRKMNGGKVPIKNIIKTLLYVLIAVLVSLGANSPNLQTLKDGLLMIYNGQCNTITNRLWSWVGIENPVCALYNNLLFKIIPNALLGNAEALTKLVGIFSIGFGGPIMIVKQIDSIGQILEDTVNSYLTIENSSDQIQTNNDLALSNQLSKTGGKKTKKRRRRQ